MESPFSLWSMIFVDNVPLFYFKIQSIAYSDDEVKCTVEKCYAGQNVIL